MKLTILTTHEKKIHTVAWLEVNTTVGNFVLQGGQAPMVLLLTKNKPIIFRLKSGKQESFVTQGGVLEIVRDEAIVLLAD